MHSGGTQHFSIWAKAMLIYKICTAAEWAEAEREGDYAGSAKDRADGFLHFSLAEQVPGTLERYYSGADDLVLAAVDPQPLGAALKYEPASNGALYPHLYGALPMACVKWVKPIRRGEEMML